MYEGVPDEIDKLGFHMGATYYELLEFCQSLSRGQRTQQFSPTVSVKDGLMAVAMGVAAQIAAQEGRVVMMSEVLQGNLEYDPTKRMDGPAHL